MALMTASVSSAAEARGRGNKRRLLHAQHAPGALTAAQRSLTCNAVANRPEVLYVHSHGVGGDVTIVGCKGRVRVGRGLR